MMESSEGLCEQESICSIRGNWQRINQVVLAALESMTLAEMIRPAPMPIRAVPRRHSASTAA